MWMHGRSHQAGARRAKLHPGDQGAGCIIEVYCPQGFNLAEWRQPDGKPDSGKRVRSESYSSHPGKYDIEGSEMGAKVNLEVDMLARYVERLMGIA